MSWLFTVMAGVLGAVMGGGGMLAMATASVRWHRVSSFEGGSGYFVVGFTLVGIVLGFLVAIVSARVVHAGIRPDWWAQVGGALLVVSLLVGLATLASYLRADFVPQRQGRPMAIEWEVRLPASQTERPAWPDEELRLQLVATVGSERRPSGAEDAQFDRGAFRREEGQWVLPARVAVFTGRGVFCVNLTMGSRDDGFWPLCGPRPRDDEWSWSGWEHTNKSRDKPAAEAVMYRYRFVMVDAEG